MTNETIQTIRSRRSCRAYKPEQITNEELEAVLGAGTYAASAMGKQSAKIVVVPPPFWWCWPMPTPSALCRTAALSWAT